MHLWAERLNPKHEPDERAKHMKRWDGLVDGYIKLCESRGLSETTMIGVRNELDRWGCWMKRRRPKPNLEEVDGLMLIELYTPTKAPVVPKEITLEQLLDRRTK
jgi:hypothetical protein